LARTKFKGPFSLIRELLKHGNCIKSIRQYGETGILEIVLAGKAVITAQLLEGMRESEYIPHDKFNFNSVDPVSIDSGSLGDFLSDIKNEDDVPEFVCTTLRFKDTKPPPLENSVEGNTEELRMEPLKTELVAAGFESDCSSCGCDLDTEDNQGDDMIDDENAEDGGR